MTLAASLARRAAGVMGRLGRRSSVVHLLIVLTAIPSIGVPAFGWSFIHDRLERADAADRVAHGLRGIAYLDKLRVAVANERASAALASALVALKPPESMRRLIPKEGLGDSGAANTSTDAALAAVTKHGLAAVPDSARIMTELRAELAMGRKATQSAVASGSVEAFKDLFTQTHYDAAIKIAQDLERSAMRSIGQGELGIGTPQLLKATAQTQAVSAVVIHGSRSVEIFFEFQLTNVSDPQRMRQLEQSTVTFDTLAAELDPILSVPVRQVWDKLVVSPDVIALRERLAAYLDEADQGRAAQAQISVLSLASLLGIGTQALTYTTSLSALLEKAVAEGVAAANHDQAVAASRARTGIMLTAVALLSTVFMLVVVGGLIRRRLRELATAAGRLSSGTLLPMPVHGPREVAIASEGLNDAVTSLREITTKADLIARGDISSPLLEQPSPGPLGAAMHASFENVVVMVREREAMQQQLAHQAAHDGLTGLANRTQTERILASAVDQVRRSGGLVGLLFLDLDRFKYCNDTYGHHAGDKVLLAVSQRLTTELEQLGVAGRLGGDEFVAIVADLQGHTQLAAIGERIAQAVREPVFYEEHMLNVGASIGMCVWPGRGSGDGSDDDVDDGVPTSTVVEWMLSQADAAMYRAKSAGRDTVTF